MLAIPGQRDRLLTVAQLKTQRNLVLPFWLLRYSELRGRLAQYSRSSPEAARTTKDYLDSLENSIKVRRMQLAALLDDRMMDERATEERKLREAVVANPKLKATAGAAWDEIARAEVTSRDILVPYALIEGAAGFNSELFGYARSLVRAADEREKPNPDRLREYHGRAVAANPSATDGRDPRLCGTGAGDGSPSRSSGCANILGPDHPIVKRSARGRVAGRARDGAHLRHEAGGCEGPDGALRRRQENRGCQHRSDDRARPRHRRRGARATKNLRDPGTGTEARAAQRAIADARFACLRHQPLP